MGCCASLLKCCVRAETDNPLLDSGHSGGGAGNGQQVRKERVERTPQHDVLFLFFKYQVNWENQSKTLESGIC